MVGALGCKYNIAMISPIKVHIPLGTAREYSLHHDTGL